MKINTDANQFKWSFDYNGFEPNFLPFDDSYLNFQKCETTKVTVLKSIPQTKCDQHKRQLCTDPICPLVVENEVCQDIEKTVGSSNS